ncbi:MAG: ABC transporter ATP-binding protein [Anaerolineae bacterium]|jgi:iron complex transport system ATP-binding protein
MTAQGIISARDLSFRYDGSARPVLQNISLDVPAHTITAILGPNGSGKTTLLRLLLGFLRADKGTILLAGKPQATYSRQERSQLIGLVPQDEHIPFDFSVLEYILLGRAPYLAPLEMPKEEDRQIALMALHMTGFAHLKDRALPNLSGGERQLALIARALAQRPSILLMDEPTAHLDLSNQGRILAIMRHLVSQGVTLVLTTHDPNIASTVASSAILMRHGQILDAGPTESVLTEEKLSATYDAPVQVIDVGERRIILLH